MNMRYCVKCGKQIQNNNKFCPYCGHPVTPVENLEKRVEASTPQAPTSDDQESQLKEIQEISFLEKWGSSERINKLIKIYTTIVLIIAICLYGMVKNEDKWAENLMKQEDGLETLKGVFQLLQVVPFLYYVLFIFAIIILVFAIYRFLRNFKGKVHLLYSVGLGISVYSIYQFHDIIDLIKQAGKYASQAQSEGLESLFRNDYSDSISTVSNIVSSASSYKTTAIILVIVTVALLIISILSKMQDDNKITVSPWIAMESTQESAPRDMSYLTNAIVSPKNKRILIGILVLVLCIGGFTVWDKYLNRTDVDVLKNVKLEYDGISGEADADIASNKISYKGDDDEVKEFLNNNITYSLSKDSGIKNGDTITVTAGYNEDRAKELKLNLKDTKKKIKVSGLDHRFDQAGDIPSEMLSTLRNDADEETNNYYEDDDYSTYQVTYINSWFIKDEDSYSGDKYVACYKIDETESSVWDSSTTNSSFFAYAYVGNLNSAYSSDDSSWNVSSIQDDSVTSSKQLQSALASEFTVDEDQVESID